MPGDVEAVLLDLDGTLADTAPDLAAAGNRLRCERGLAALEPAGIRPHVSGGTTAILGWALALGPADPGFAAARRRYLALYRRELARAPRLVPGMDVLLDRLEQAGYRWGVVTNKPAWLTRPLLAGLGLLERSACVVCGDSTPHPKPHPAPLELAARVLGLPPERCVYVGDARSDVEAGRRAGMPAVLALFGYLPDGAVPTAWGAAGLIAHPLALLAWLAAGERPAAGERR